MPLPAFTFADAMVRVSASTEGLAQGLLKAQTDAQKRVAGITKVLGGIGTAMTLVGGAVVLAIGRMISKSVEYGSQIHDMSQRTGFTTEKLSELSYAAGQSGTSLEGLEIGIRKMQKAITEAGDQQEKAAGKVTNNSAAIEKLNAQIAIQLQKQNEMTASGKASASQMMAQSEKIQLLYQDLEELEFSHGKVATATGAQTEALGKLGLTYTDLKDLSPEKQFETIILRLAELKDPTEKAALATEFFGRAGTNLLPMLEGGAEGLKQMAEKAKELGLILSPEEAKKLEAFGDAMGEVEKGITGIALAVTEALLGEDMDKWVEKIQGAVKSIKEWVDANPELVKGIAKVAVALAIGGPFMLGLSATIKALATIVGLIGAAGATGAAGGGAAAAGAAGGIAGWGLLPALLALGVALAAWKGTNAFMEWLGFAGNKIEWLTNLFEGLITKMRAVDDFLRGLNGEKLAKLDVIRAGAPLPGSLPPMPGEGGFMPAGSSMRAQPSSSMAFAGSGGPVTNNNSSTFNFAVNGVNDPEQIARDLGRIMRRRKL